MQRHWEPNNRLLWNAYAEIEFPSTASRHRFPMTMDWTLAQLLAYVGTWSALRRCLASEGPAFLQVAASELNACWGEAGCARREHAAARGGRALA
ncbi:MAG: hypothetical protein U1F67_01030 [Rubrivivax sp.]